MFQGLINSAKTAVSSLVIKYVARASVAVPFVIALGFALAAIAALAVDRFGHIAGYWLMAAASPPSAQSRPSLCPPGNRKRRWRTKKLKQPTHPTLQLRSPPRRPWLFWVVY